MIPVPAAGTVDLGGTLIAVATRTTLSVYDTDNGALKYQLPLSRTTGVPRLLTVGAGYAAYASGIELHLLRLDNGNDRIVDLPGQDGPSPSVPDNRGAVHRLRPRLRPAARTDPVRTRGEPALTLNTGAADRDRASSAIAANTTFTRTRSWALRFSRRDRYARPQGVSDSLRVHLKPNAGPARSSRRSELPADRTPAANASAGAILRVAQNA